MAAMRSLEVPRTIHRRLSFFMFASLDDLSTTSLNVSCSTVGGSRKNEPTSIGGSIDQRRQRERALDSVHVGFQSQPEGDAHQ
jgi:hypothetical protein